MRSTQLLRPCYGHSRTNTSRPLPTLSTTNCTASLPKLICSFPGYPEVSSKSYHRYQSWSEYVIKRYQIFKLHPMAAAHEVTLITKSISVITKVEVNPSIAHPLPFSPIMQEMDAWYEAGNLLDLLHYLKKLDAYTSDA